MTTDRDDMLDFVYHNNYWKPSPTIVDLDFDNVSCFKMGGKKYIREDLTAKTPIDMPKIKDCIFHENATIILWEDGTKTVVKCQPGDTWNDEMGVLECIAKKAYGNSGAFNKIVMKAIDQGNAHYKKQINRSINKDLKNRIRLYKALNDLI